MANTRKPSLKKTFTLKGASYRHGDIVRALARKLLHVGSLVVLVRDPDNQYDDNAIKVFADPYTTLHIGFVPRELALDISPKIDEQLQAIWRCEGSIKECKYDEKTKKIIIKCDFSKAFKIESSPPLRKCHQRLNSNSNSNFQQPPCKSNSCHPKANNQQKSIEHASVKTSLCQTAPLSSKTNEIAHPAPLTFRETKASSEKLCITPSSAAFTPPFIEILGDPELISDHTPFNSSKQNSHSIPQNFTHNQGQGGLYLIHDPSFKKIYIGQTTSYSRRWRQHYEQLINQTHGNHKLQQLFNLDHKLLSCSPLITISELFPNQKKIKIEDAKDLLWTLEIKYISNPGSAPHNSLKTQGTTLLNIEAGGPSCDEINLFARIYPLLEPWFTKKWNINDLSSQPIYTTAANSPSGTASPIGLNNISQTQTYARPSGQDKETQLTNKKCEPSLIPKPINNIATRQPHHPRYNRSFFHSILMGLGSLFILVALFSHTSKTDLITPQEDIPSNNIQPPQQQAEPRSSNIQTKKANAFVISANNVNNMVTLDILAYSSIDGDSLRIRYGEVSVDNKCKFSGTHKVASAIKKLTPINENITFESTHNIVEDFCVEAEVVIIDK